VEMVQTKLMFQLGAEPPLHGCGNTLKRFSPMNQTNILSLVRFVGMLNKWKNPKTTSGKKNDDIGTMSPLLRSELRPWLEPIKGVIRWIRAAKYAKRIFKLKCEEYGLRKKKVISLDTPTKWNSTYKLLHDAIAYRDVLTDMYNEYRADGCSITNDHWSLAKIIHDVLEAFDNATNIFSYVYESNIHMVILECLKIIHSIRQTSLDNPDPSVKSVLDIMKDKWYAYFTEFLSIYGITVILDLGVKLQ
ncbi:putative AC transposase, partial [Bienertia sinuspersici]